VAATGGGGPESPEGKGGKKGAFGEDGLGVIGMVLAAIGGSIGFLSFVAFFGAAILWVRMNRVKIPANEAVAVVPKSVLVTTGASFLAPALLIAVVLTSALFMLDRLIRRLADRYYLRNEEKRLSDAEAKVDRTQANAELALEKLDEALRLSLDLKDDSQALVSAGADPETVQRASARTGEALDAAEERAANAQPEAQRADEEFLKAKDELERVRDEKKANIERLQVVARLAVLGIAISLVAMIGITASATGLPFWQVALILAAAYFLAGVCLLILAGTNFGWFALAFIISVSLVSGFITYYRTTDHPKVEPAAVLRSGGAPVFGYFVAQTSDRIYLATRLPTGPLRLDAIPREEVTDMAVGTAVRQGAAGLRARRMARQMCVIARERDNEKKIAATAKPGKPAAAEDLPCTLQDLGRLSGTTAHDGGTPRYGVPAA
jgi:hypothetical protein